MLPEPSIEDVSYDELRALVPFLNERTQGDRPWVLVGGWAVYAYNPYAKSRDIDLVLSSRNRSSLLSWLVHERAYRRFRTGMRGWEGARKVLSPDTWLVVDVASYGKSFPFEGREEHLDFALVQQHATLQRIDELLVRVPNRSLLLLYKLKASFDRPERLRAGQSPDPGWERGKVTKDRSDVLALLDSPRPQWDISLLGDQLARLPFLTTTLREVLDQDAIERYEGLDVDEATEAVESLIDVVGVSH